MDNLLIIDLKGFINQRVLNNFRTERLQKEIFINGKQVFEDLSINELKEYVDMQMNHSYYSPTTTRYFYYTKKNVIIKIQKNYTYDNWRLLWLI